MGTMVPFHPFSIIYNGSKSMSGETLGSLAEAGACWDSLRLVPWRRGRPMSIK